jgi:hypothetical protein
MTSNSVGRRLVRGNQGGNGTPLIKQQKHEGGASLWAGHLLPHCGRRRSSLTTQTWQTCPDSDTSCAAQRGVSAGRVAGQNQQCSSHADKCKRMCSILYLGRRNESASRRDGGSHVSTSVCCRGCESFKKAVAWLY